jgi:hypothetical protein
VIVMTMVVAVTGAHRSPFAKNRPWSYEDQRLVSWESRRRASVSTSGCLQKANRT